MSARDLIPPTLDAMGAYAAALKLGETVRQVRADAAELYRDYQRYVEEPYGNYVHFHAIRQGFLKGYGASETAIMPGEMDGQQVPFVQSSIKIGSATNAD